MASILDTISKSIGVSSKIKTTASRFDLIAIGISVAGFIAAYLVTIHIFEAVPHLEDEVAYVWQAKLLSTGKLFMESPEHPKSFLVPFVVDYEGLRFGKYPIGWPLVLAAGIILHVRSFVNPFLAGLGVWLTYRLGKNIFSPIAGLLAAILTVSSPFFLVNSGSLLSHPLGLVLSAAFTLTWIRAFGDRKVPHRWGTTILAAALLGALVITRPMTAVAVALPFAVHGLVLMIRGGSQTRVHLLAFGLIAAAIGSLHFLWQYLLTGDPMLNPYTLWWDYDKIGFGPGHGVSEEGHTYDQAFINTRQSLRQGKMDLFGWWTYSWVLLPFGLWASRKNWKGLLAASVFPSHVLVYMAYWIGSSLFGPRYYYEGLYSLTVMTAVGALWLAGIGSENGDDIAGESPSNRYLAGFQKFASRISLGWKKLERIRLWIVAAALIFAMGYNIFVYLPYRLQKMYNLYGMSRSDIEPFLTPEAEEMTPALIIVHSQRWMSYGVLLDLEDPALTTPFIFAWSRGDRVDTALANDYPDRNIYHYYPNEEPESFYTSPKEE